METGEFGLVVTASSGAVRFAQGLGSDPRSLRALLKVVSTRRDAAGGTAYVESEGGCLIAWRALPDGHCFLIQRAQAPSSVLTLMGSVDGAQAVLEHLLDWPSDTTVVVDENGRVRFASRGHEEVFGIRLDRQPDGVAPEELRLNEVIHSGTPDVDRLQTIAGTPRLVTSVPLLAQGRSVGAIARVTPRDGRGVQHLARQARPSVVETVAAPARIDLGRRPSDLDQMIGDSEALQQLKSDIAKIAPLNVPVLIVGESGTGKELAAQAIHALSGRADKQMVFVNAAALPGGLVESELFGYEPGAFTGAERSGRKGKFELADRSSLFFDEVGDMPPEIQVKLLRVLQDGMFERVGSNRAQRSDFRLICATNRNFQEMITSGEFRLDLYYRISGVTVRMPSLRDRLGDIPSLVRRFLDAFAERHRTPGKGIGKGVVGYLSEQPWPGNVRQLLHEVERAAIFCDGPDIQLEDFRLLGVTPHKASPAPGPMPEVRTGTLQDAFAEIEKGMIRDAMKAHRGNKKRVAEVLGISRAYLYKKLGEAE